jgi:hypothetical protein
MTDSIPAAERELAALRQLVADAPDGALDRVAAQVNVRVELYITDGAVARAVCARMTAEVEGAPVGPVESAQVAILRAEVDDLKRRLSERIAAEREAEPARARVGELITRLSALLHRRDELRRQLAELRAELQGAPS